MVQKIKKPIAKLKNNIKEKQALVKFQEQKVEYSGIIPHPDIVEGYEKICPGATDRILKMTEEELIHTRNLENKNEDSIIECRRLALKSEIWTNMLATIFAYLLLFTAIIGAILLLLKGKKIEGFATFMGVIGTCIASAFWKNYIKSKKKEEIEENK